MGCEWFTVVGPGRRRARDVRTAALLGLSAFVLPAAGPPETASPRARDVGATAPRPPAVNGAAPTVPTATPLPLPEALPDPKPATSNAPGARPGPADEGPALRLRPGTAPPPAAGPSSLIDLPHALQLGNANNLTIALARNRIASAVVAWRQAQIRWLPDLQWNTTYLLHDGLIQRAPGEIITTNRQSLFVGGGPYLKWQLNETIMAPIIARSLIRATVAAEVAVANQTLQEIAERYLDLLAAYSAAEIAREATTNAAELTRLTEEFERTGAGLPSDTARARAELWTRRQQLELSAERIAVSSVGLAQPLLLDSTQLLVPAEPSVFPIELIPADTPIHELVAQGLAARPELAENRALVDAAIGRLQQTKLRPWLPRIEVGFAAGGFGGGASGFPGGQDARFGGRNDFNVAALWEVRGLGLGEMAARQQRRVEISGAEIRLARVANQVMAEVAAAQKSIESRRRQIATTQQAVAEALRSHELNQRRIQGGAGLPIEVLQSIQALERSRTEYLNAVTSYNKAQFRLLTALGTTPTAPTGPAPPSSPRPAPEATDEAPRQP